MFAEIKLSFVFLYNTGKAGHISTAMWDAEEAGPLECGMKIYENNMQISIVPVIQNKQTNDGNENDCASRRIPDSAYSVVQVWECVCVCVSQCMCACVYACVCKGDRGEAMRSECSKEISTSTLFCYVLRPRNAFPCQE